MAEDGRERLISFPSLQPPGLRAASHAEIMLATSPLLHPLPPFPVLLSVETCTGQDLADLGDRLRDWFQLLHENSKQNSSASSGASLAGGMGAGCPAWGQGG